MKGLEIILMGLFYFYYGILFLMLPCAIAILIFYRGKSKLLRITSIFLIFVSVYFYLKVLPLEHLFAEEDKYSRFVDIVTAMPIGLIHLGILSLLPVGIIVFFSKNKKFINKAVGISFMIASIPGYIFLQSISPFDFIFPFLETRMPVQVNNYKVTLVNRAGFDFYDTFFEIKRTDNKKTIVFVDSDDNKWWRPTKKKIENRIYFLRNSHKIDKSSPWVNFETLELYTGGVVGRIEKIPELEFE